MHFLHKNICRFPNWFTKLFLKTTSYKLRMSLSYTRFPRNRVWDKNLCCRCSWKGLRVDSCLTLRNDLSKETHILTKERLYCKRVLDQRTVGWGNPGELLCPWLEVLGFMLMGLFPGGLWPIILIQGLSWWRRHPQPRWVLARGILGSGRTGGVSFRPFPNSSGWWWLISSAFLIRLSCHKTTHANGYYGAWPGWVVSISGLPLTKLLDLKMSQ